MSVDKNDIKLFDTLSEWRDKLIDKLDEDNPRDLRPARVKLVTKINNICSKISSKRTEYEILLEKIEDAKEELAGLKQMIRKTESVVNQHKRDMEKAKSNIIYTPEEQRKVVNKYWKIQRNLQKEANKVEEKHQELIIKQEELVQAINDTELACSSYYKLTDKERQLFEEDRPRILAAIEQKGNLAAALRHDKNIKSTLKAIMYYANKHPAFKADLDIARQIFKENLDSTVLERALDGTENPVFQKGEYIGDYKVKDNKLLMEVAKANIPEKYDRKAYAAENPPSTTNNTINIINYENVDETKHGYTRNIGLVTDVDDSGRVRRIMQQNKMLELASKRDDVEIFIPEENDND